MEIKTAAFLLRKIKTFPPPKKKRSKTPGKINQDKRNFCEISQLHQKSKLANFYENF